MSCPCLEGKKYLRCAAVAGTVVLSRAELDERCMADYRSCPIYRAFQAGNGGRISLADYAVFFMRFVKESDRRKAGTSLRKDRDHAPPLLGDSTKRSPEGPRDPRARTNKW